MLKWNRLNLFLGEGSIHGRAFPKFCKMKTAIYHEGPEAKERFERGMKALFQVPKAEVVKKQKKQAKKPATLRKSKRSDKD